MRNRDVTPMIKEHEITGDARRSNATKALLHPNWNAAATSNAFER
eukprot:CAMPEP_0185854650 /NCGR_PEP_ID=MMETSP1354-20130828/23047_1 /TAXON_ID=708628 /ORGANISM="Erythrolobus madagascarensis, Strain CCMP3276" /LENGTH=44 /DNA_ID= /DNA_START= /DNA_END= /DNA_ORIENTATION=